MAMKEIDIREVKENLVHLLADEWALVTAGRGDALGTMTVSWGGIGELWGKDVVAVFVRPQRRRQSDTLACLRLSPSFERV